MRATHYLLAATLALLSLPAPPRARGGPGLPASAIFGGFHQAAAAPAALATTLTLDTNSSGTHPDLPKTPLALTHGAPLTHATAPTQPERNHETAPPNSAHAARTHTRPKKLNPLAGHTLHTEAPPHPARPRNCTSVHATHSQRDASIERSYNYGVVPLKNSNRQPKNDTQLRHSMSKSNANTYANTYVKTLPPIPQLCRTHLKINEPKTTTPHPSKPPTKQHAPQRPISHPTRAHTNRHVRRTKHLRRHAAADSGHERDQSGPLPQQRNAQRCEGPHDRTHHLRVQPPSLPPLRGARAKRLDPGEPPRGAPHTATHGAPQGLIRPREEGLRNSSDLRRGKLPRGPGIRRQAGPHRRRLLHRQERNRVAEMRLHPAVRAVLGRPDPEDQKNRHQTVVHRPGQSQHPARPLGHLDRHDRDPRKGKPARHDGEGGPERGGHAQRQIPHRLRPQGTWARNPVEPLLPHQDRQTPHHQGVTGRTRTHHEPQPGLDPRGQPMPPRLLLRQLRAQPRQTNPWQTQGQRAGETASHEQVHEGRLILGVPTPLPTPRVTRRGAWAFYGRYPEGRGDTARCPPQVPVTDLPDVPTQRGPPQRTHPPLVPQTLGKPVRKTEQALQETSHPCHSSSRGHRPRSVQLSPPLVWLRGVMDPDENKTKINNLNTKIPRPPRSTRAHPTPPQKMTHTRPHGTQLAWKSFIRIDTRESKARGTQKKRERKRRTKTHPTKDPKDTPPNTQDPTKPRPTTWIRDTTEEGIEPNPGPLVISKNINGITNSADATLNKIHNAHKLTPILVVGLQEHNITATHARSLDIENLARNRGLLYLQADRPVADLKGGAALIIPFDQVELSPGEKSIGEAVKRIQRSVYRSPDGRLVTADIRYHGHTVRLAACYAPADSGTRPTFLRDITPRLNKNTVLLIDANCVLDKELDLDRKSKSDYPNKGAAELRQLLITHDLTDIVREFNGNKPHFTNHTLTASRSITKTRIDQIHAPALDATTWTVSKRSDFLNKTKFGHNAVIVSLTPVTQTRGQDVLRINEAVYDDPIFLDELATLLTEAATSTTIPTGKWGDTWETLKRIIRTKSLAQTLLLKTARNQQKRALELLLSALETKITAGKGLMADYTDREDLKGKIRAATKEHFSLHEVIEEMAYSRGQRHDVSTAAFHRQYTPRNAAQWVESILYQDWTDLNNPTTSGPNITEAPNIANIFAKYYRALYAKPKTHAASIAAAIRTLTTGNKCLKPTASKCDKDITLQEVLHISSHIPIGKSPGPDCIPNKFYKTMSKHTAPILVNVYNESRTRGTLPKTMSQGTISVLYKKGARDNPTNYRPITLLNGDYKILMRILTERMNESIVQWISKDQNGFVPDAFIAENIIRLQNLQQQIEEEDSDALFLFADMEKAFDRCSWEFIIEGLKALEYGDDFIKFIKLAYNHDTPPERQLHVNGYLSAPFSLHSGVAQGCPLSPLLFLIIAEPLTRLINNNPNIEGIRSGGISHKISQFADDSTFLCRLKDVIPTLAMVRIWERATGMKENMTKREVLLLGQLPIKYISMKRNPDNIRKTTRDALQAALPNGLTPTPTGKTIRALGVPMGTNFDESDWWHARYATVKARLTKWHGLSRLSLTGRNILLQSILYGSIRYWLFTMVPPPEVIELIESDAKELLWATNPHLDTSEKGTDRASIRWMHRLASYLPQREGGGGATHLDSHIAAFQAQWIIRYLDPRESPWKQTLDQWILHEKGSVDAKGNHTIGARDDAGLGRAVLLLRPDIDYAARLPPEAKYMRACLNSFRTLKITQDTSLITHETQGEPLWENNRFETQLHPAHIKEWTTHLQTTRLSNLLDRNNRFWDCEDWKNFMKFEGFHPPHLSDPERKQWRKERLLDQPTIRTGIPRPVRDAIKSPPAFQDEDIVQVSSPTFEGYARYELTPNGPPTLHELHLDLSGYPHETGTIHHPDANTALTHTAKWKHTKEEDFEAHDTEARPTDTKQKVKTSIIGPTTTSFPLDQGWYAEGLPPRTLNGSPRTLSSLTIHEITTILTKRIIANAPTEDQRPHCEAAWRSRFPTREIPTIPWKEIWQSLRTPLSDPTEEKNWHRLLHRAWDAKNRHPLIPDHTCRLGCEHHEEDILHMIKCKHARPFWKACEDFDKTTLHHTYDNRRLEEIIIFNTCNGKLIPESSRLFWRHAVGKYYAAVTVVHKQKKRFSWQKTFHWTLSGLQDATLRTAHKTRLLHINRTHTPLTNQIPQEARTRFHPLISIHPDGTHTINPTFTAAITKAKETYEATLAKPPPATQNAALPMPPPNT